jgi:hypothetical protein
MNELKRILAIVIWRRREIDLRLHGYILMYDERRMNKEHHSTLYSPMIGSSLASPILGSFPTAESA